MTEEELIQAIDAIDCDDPEVAHYSLDGLLFDQQPPAVQEAMRRLFGRCRWWACA